VPLAVDEGARALGLAIAPIRLACLIVRVRFVRFAVVWPICVITYGGGSPIANNSDANVRRSECAVRPEGSCSRSSSASCSCC
jgi:hypothetical protein